MMCLYKEEGRGVRESSEEAAGKKGYVEDIGVICLVEAVLLGFVGREVVFSGGFGVVATT